MAGIFISYRRDDAAGHAGRLFDRLREQFGADNVFMDVEGIAPGTDFVHALQRAVGASDVALAVIGPAWLECTNDQGRRRLEDPEDFVRIEVASALRQNKTVIPVLVHDAEMPAQERLPGELQALARRQGVTLSDANWESDCTQLVGTLRGLLKTPSARARGDDSVWAMLRKLLSKPIPIAVVLTLAAAAYGWRALQQQRTNVSHSLPAPARTQALPGSVERAAPPTAGSDSAAAPESETTATAESTATLAAESETRSDAQSKTTPAAQNGTTPAALVADLRASIAGLDFGALRIGRGDVQQLRIINRGRGAAASLRMGFTGEEGGDYSLTHDCGKAIAPNASCDVRVRFSPSEPGARKTLLSVEYFGSNSPLIVKVYGEGVSKAEARGEVPRAAQRSK